VLPTEPGTFRFPDGAEIDTRLAKFRRANRYGLDREKQRTLSFTGIPFIPTQDQAMTEGMGYVCDRPGEHLGSSDIAIIHMRRKMLHMLEEFEKGVEPSPRRTPTSTACNRWTWCQTSRSWTRCSRSSRSRRSSRLELNSMGARLDAGPQRTQARVWSWW
jgi:hypothetical protein